MFALLYNRRFALLPACGAAVLCLACGTDPLGGPLELSITAPSGAETIYDLDPVTLRGQVTAPDLGPLPDDSIWWTVDDVVIGTGPEARYRATAGQHTASLHARYGKARDSVDRTITVDAAGLARLLWTVPLDVNTGDGLSLDPGGVLYASDDAGATAVAIGVDGTVRWRASLGLTGQRVPPAIGPDGALFYPYWMNDSGAPDSLVGGVVALNPDGSPRWTFAAVDVAPVGSASYHARGGVAVDGNGNVYVATQEDDAPIYSIFPNGTLRWREATAAGAVPARRFWSFTTLIADSLVTSIAARDSAPISAAGDGARRWNAAVPGNSDSCLLAAAVGAVSRIYVPRFRGEVTAYAPGGTEVFTRGLPVRPRVGSPIVGQDRVYFSGSNGGVVYFPTDGGFTNTWGVPPAGGLTDGLTLGAHGVVYVAADGFLVSYDSLGGERFNIPIPHRVSASCVAVQGGPVLGPDGTIYLRASDAGVMAFRDTVGPATDAPWPTLQGNYRRTGQRAID